MRLRNQALKDEIMRMGSEKEAWVGELDKNLSGEDVLPALLAPYRGKAVLVDFGPLGVLPAGKVLRSCVRSEKAGIGACRISLSYGTLFS